MNITENNGFQTISQYQIMLQQRKAGDDLDILTNEAQATAQTFAELIADLCAENFMQTQMASMLNRITTALHYNVLALHKQQGETNDKLNAAVREFSGDEVDDVNIQSLQENAYAVNDQVVVMEAFRDALADGVLHYTGNAWTPPSGSVAASPVSAAVIEAKDYLRAAKQAQTEKHLPKGTLIAFSGTREYSNIDAAYRMLDKVHAKYQDMVLMHCGDKLGGDSIAASWAQRSKVDTIVCKPDWNAHGKAAPFKRNDQIVALRPLGLVACPGGNGINANLVQKCNAAGIKIVMLPKT